MKISKGIKMEILCLQLIMILQKKYTVNYVLGPVETFQG